MEPTIADALAAMDMHAGSKFNGADSVVWGEEDAEEHSPERGHAPARAEEAARLAVMGRPAADRPRTSKDEPAEDPGTWKRTAGYRLDDGPRDLPQTADLSEDAQDERTEKRQVKMSKGREAMFARMFGQGQESS